MTELRRALTVWTVLALAGAAVFALSLAAGSVSLDATQLWQALTGADTGTAGAIVRELRLPLGVDYRCPPWDRLPPGATVAVVVGARHVVVPETAHEVRQRAVGARDVDALTFLVGLAQRELHLDCRFALHSAPTDLSPDRAAGLLERLRRQPGVGAVVVLGSPLVNALPAQMLGYHAALLRGNDPDKPRNLAKSVTVK